MFKSNGQNGDDKVSILLMDVTDIEKSLKNFFKIMELATFVPELSTFGHELPSFVLA